MNIKPGVLISFEKDGIVYTDRVAGVSYSSPTPAIYRPLSLRQRIIRRLTPRRLRKPLLLIRAAQPGGLMVSTDADPTQFQRHITQISDIYETMNGLLGK